MNQAYFQKALDEFFLQEREHIGIGTLGEKAVHAVLKSYYEPNTACHEVKCGEFVADILSDGHITEIQSRGFERLIPKLTSFLREYHVTVVYPIAVNKEIIWLDPKTGELHAPRISNRHGHPLDLFTELYRIRRFLSHPHFQVRVVLMNVREYRALDGRGNQKKIHATKLDRFPTELLEEIELKTPQDYDRFLPKNLPELFTASELQKRTGASLHSAQYALRLLREWGIVELIGKQDRKNVYKIYNIGSENFHNNS